MSPNEPEMPPSELPDTTPEPEIAPADTPQEIPAYDPGGGEGGFGQPMS